MKLPKLYFKYSNQKVRDPNTGERQVIHLPKVPCRFKNGSRTRADNAILDSGADQCVINMKMARNLDLDLKESLPMRVVGNEECKSYEARVELILGGGKRTEPFFIDVKIPSEGDTPTLIGRDPVFNMFVITFIERELKFNMIPYEDY